MATGAEVVPTGAGDPTRATGPDQGKTTGTVQHKYAKIMGEPHITPDRECRALGMECYTCHRIGHLSHMCRQNIESDMTEDQTHRHRRRVSRLSPE